MLRFSNVYGSEKTPVSNFLFAFSYTDLVNSKLPCVKPPPATNCKPTKSFENVCVPTPGAGG